jgi:hypothetical protein
MLKPADSVSITFRISSLKSNFSTRRESDGNKKYRTGFDRSNDTEQVSNSRKSLHVRCLWRISKESIVTKRVAPGDFLDIGVSFGAREKPLRTVSCLIEGCFLVGFARGFGYVMLLRCAMS